MSDPVFHFAGGVVAGAISSALFRRWSYSHLIDGVDEKPRKEIVTVQVVLDSVICGALSVMVDFDHLPHLLYKNGYSDFDFVRKPLHPMLMWLSVACFLLLMFLIKSTKLTSYIDLKTYVILAGLVFFCHYLLDYYLVFMVYHKAVVCFLANSQGQKLIELFSLFGPGP